jgi:serpin B
MNIIYSAALSLTLSLLFCSCSPSNTQSTVHSTESGETIQNENNQFAFDFLKQLKNRSENLCFSPYSISTAFSMTAIGAKGITANQMWSTLHYNPNQLAALKHLTEALTVEKKSDQDAEVLLSNALWVQKDLPIENQFRKTMQEDFTAPFESLDFIHQPALAIQRINQWVKKSTRSKIEEIVTPDNVSSDTRLILTSAIYMKAQWKHPFEKNATTQKTFYVSNEKSIEVPFMYNTNYFKLFEGEGVTMLELPYYFESEKAPKLSFVLLMPSLESSVTSLEAKLSPVQWSEWMSLAEYRNVELSMPKFKIESELDLNEIMISLGMKEAFTPQADFSGITGGRDLFINKAVHKTFIDVDEKGTEAAAATVVMMALTSWIEPEKAYPLAINHPFIYFIVDQNTNTILFMGRVVEP